MPVYEFRCKRCETEIELTYKMDEKKTTPKCPKCQKYMSRVFSKAGHTWRDKDRP